MKLSKFIKALPKLPWILSYSLLWSKATNDRDHGRLIEALAKLDRLDEMMPDQAEHSLLRAYCHLGLRDFAAGKDALKNIDDALASSKMPEPDKKYFQLYAKYLRHELLNKGRERPALDKIFREAATLKQLVRENTVSIFPLGWK